MVNLKDVRTVAIVGAGPAGLALANALEQRGFAVTVFEQARRFERVGAGIQLAPNATAVFDGIGRLDDLMKVGVLPEVAQAYEWDTGRPLTRNIIGANRYRTPYVQVHRADLHQALLSGLRSTGVLNGKRLQRLEDHPDGVSLHFDDGSLAEADLVVGADGLHSVVREHLFGARPTQFSGWAAHRAMLNAADVSDLGIEVVAAKWMGPDRHVIHYWVTPQELTFIAVLPQREVSVESWSRESDPGEVMEALNGFNDRLLELVRRASVINKWAIYDRDALFTWSRGRVTLIGDAAHPMRPFMAQGGCSALEDAAVLARSLTSEESTLLEALTLYEANRKPRATWLQSVSRTHGFRLPEFTHKESPSAAHYVYSYDAWRDVLVQPKRDTLVAHEANRGNA